MIAFTQEIRRAARLEALPGRLRRQHRERRGIRVTPFTQFMQVGVQLFHWGGPPLAVYYASVDASRGAWAVAGAFVLFPSLARGELVQSVSDFTHLRMPSLPALRIARWLHAAPWLLLASVAAGMIAGQVNRCTPAGIGFLTLLPMWLFSRTGDRGGERVWSASGLLDAFLLLTAGLLVFRPDRTLPVWLEWTALIAALLSIGWHFANQLATCTQPPDHGDTDAEADAVDETTATAAAGGSPAPTVAARPLPTAHAGRLPFARSRTRLWQLRFGSIWRHGSIHGRFWLLATTAAAWSLLVGVGALVFANAGTDSIRPVWLLLGLVLWDPLWTPRHEPTVWLRGVDYRTQDRIALLHTLLWGWVPRTVGTLAAWWLLGRTLGIGLPLLAVIPGLGLLTIGWSGLVNAPDGSVSGCLAFLAVLLPALVVDSLDREWLLGIAGITAFAGLLGIARRWVGWDESTLAAEAAETAYETDPA